MNLETYDIVMLAVLLAATVFGAWRGLAWQMASLVAICASYFVAFQFRHTFAAWIPLEAPWNVFVAMLALYVLTSLGIWVIFSWISKLIDRIKFRQFDRQFGALLGFTKGVVLCVIITLFAVTLLGDQHRQTIVNSKSGYYIAVLLDKADRLMPEEIHEVLRPCLRAMDDGLLSAEGEAAEQGRAPTEDAFPRGAGVPANLGF